MSVGKLALHGGEPVRTAPPPEWPVYDEREAEAAARVARSGKWQYGGGTEGTELETEFADWIGAAHAIGTINGTETMTIAMALRTNCARTSSESSASATTRITALKTGARS